MGRGGITSGARSALVPAPVARPGTDPDSLEGRFAATIEAGRAATERVWSVDDDPTIERLREELERLAALVADERVRELIERTHGPALASYGDGDLAPASALARDLTAQIATSLTQVMQRLEDINRAVRYPLGDAAVKLEREVHMRERRRLRRERQVAILAEGRTFPGGQATLEDLIYGSLEVPGSLPLKQITFKVKSGRQVSLPERGYHQHLRGIDLVTVADLRRAVLDYDQRLRWSSSETDHVDITYVESYSSRTVSFSEVLIPLDALARAVVAHAQAPSA